jgi:hypothetical protein
MPIDLHGEPGQAGGHCDPSASTDKECALNLVQDKMEGRAGLELQPDRYERSAFRR